MIIIPTQSIEKLHTFDRLHIKFAYVWSENTLVSTKKPVYVNRCERVVINRFGYHNCRYFENKKLDVRATRLRCKL